jgi:cyanophycin synthetase
MVLDDATVEAAVLETARGGIVRGGLGYDRADVAVVTNITADHLGCDGIYDLDDLTDVKALVAEEILRGGTVVLNADDPRSAGLAQRTPVRERNPVVRFFSLSGTSPVIMAHRMSGGIACLLRDGQLIEARGGEETVLLHAGELPGSFGGAATHVVANALAAAAACRALGVSVKDIRRGFATFTRGGQPGPWPRLPGRRGPAGGGLRAQPGRAGQHGTPAPRGLGRPAHRGDHPARRSPGRPDRGERGRRGHLVQPGDHL